MNITPLRLVLHPKTKVLSRGIAAVLMLGVLMPTVAFAQDGTAGSAPEPAGATTSGAAPRTPALSDFCSRIDTVVTQIENKVSDREGKLSTKRIERAAKLDQRFTKRDEKLTVHRDNWDDNRGEMYARLDARASTSLQQAAVAKFKTDVDAAVALRRTTVDKAISDFQTAVEAAVKDRQGAVDAALLKFKNAREGTIAKAKTDCAGGADARTVREEIVLGLKAAREGLAADIKTIEKRKDTLTPLAATRKAAVDKAIKDFQTAVAKYKAELKEAFISS